MSTYRIRLRDTTNGQERAIDDISDMDTVLYSWLEGNFACDCNRSIRMYDLLLDDCRPCNSGDNTIELLSITKMCYGDFGPEVIYDRESAEDLAEQAGFHLCPKKTTQ